MWGMETESIWPEFNINLSGALNKAFPSDCLWAGGTGLVEVSYCSWNGEPEWCHLASSDFIKNMDSLPWQALSASFSESLCSFPCFLSIVKTQLKLHWNFAVLSVSKRVACEAFTEKSIPQFITLKQMTCCKFLLVCFSRCLENKDAEVTLS